MTSNSQLPNKFLQHSFYDLLDRKNSMEKMYDLLEAYQIKWNQNHQHKRGGIVASVYDVLHAVFSLIPQTMEQLKKEQPLVFKECTYTQEFFCITNNSYIASMLNNQSSRKNLRGNKERTVRRCIQKLIDAKVIVKKVNHMRTGSKDRLPEPMHEHEKGRGKFKLIFNPTVILLGQTADEINLGEAKSDSPAPSINPNIRTTCPQMYSILDNSKDNLKVCNTPTGIVDKAFAGAKSRPQSIKDSEQGSKLDSSVLPNVAPQNFAPPIFVPADFSYKLDFYAHQLFNQARVGLWNGRNFAPIETAQAVEMLSSHLRLMEDHVNLFRRKKIEQFKESAYYQGLKSPHYKKKILDSWFKKQLPNIQLSAVRIVAEALQKQRENGLKHGYLQYLYHPTSYFVSDNWEAALHYSKVDFEKLYTRFSDKNKSLGFYQLVMEHINKAHTNALLALQGAKSTNKAMEVVEKSWRQVRILIANAPPQTSQAQKDKLIRKFKDRLQPIFSNRLS